MYRENSEGNVLPEALRTNKHLSNTAAGLKVLFSNFSDRKLPFNIS